MKNAYGLVVVLVVLVIAGCGDTAAEVGDDGTGGGGGGRVDEPSPPALMSCDGLGGDADDDDWCAIHDNCPGLANADQSDVDDDGIGDVCDVEECDGVDNDGDGDVDEGFDDQDEDGVADCVDVCPANPDTDSDFDGLADCVDECPLDPGNDQDGDRVCGDVDNCPAASNFSQSDRDDDGVGDACDVEECDGVSNDNDALIDEGLPDEDEDGVCDEIDPCPGDVLNDPDDDGFCGLVDNCPGVANAGQEDTDDDGWGDACDLDATIHCDSPAALNAPGAVPVPAALEIGDVLGVAGEDTLYVSLRSSSPNYPNSIIAIDGPTESVLWSTFVGSDPQSLALADDGSYLYVDLDGAAQVRVVNVPTRQACRAFSLGSGSFGPRYAGDMGVVPGAPETIVISTRRKGVSPDFDGVYVYDHGYPRPMSTRDHTGARLIVVESGTRAWGYNNASTEAGFRELEITDAGVEEVWLERDLIFGFDLVYEEGRVYATGGRVVDVSGPFLAGSFPTSGAVTVDTAAREAFFLSDRSTVSVFDIDMFLFKRDLMLDGSLTLSSFGVKVLHRWGATGLVAADDDTLIFVQDAGL